MLNETGLVHQKTHGLEMFAFFNIVRFLIKFNKTEFLPKYVLV
jgi:hypothetical protein